MERFGEYLICSYIEYKSLLIYSTGVVAALALACIWSILAPFMWVLCLLLGGTTLNFKTTSRFYIHSLFLSLNSSKQSAISFSFDSAIRNAIH